MTEAPVPPTAVSLPQAIFAALRHPVELTRAIRESDQEIMIQTLLTLSNQNEGNHVFVINAPKIPPLYIVHSQQGIMEVGNNPAIDKPDVLPAITTGNTEAFDWIMGSGFADGKVNPKYTEQSKVAMPFIERKRKGLAAVVERHAANNLTPEPDGSVIDLHKLQAYSAGIILGDIFPAHNWDEDEVGRFVTMTERASLAIGPAFQNSVIRGLPLDQVIDSDLMRTTQETLKAEFRALLTEEEKIGQSDNKGLLRALKDAAAIPDSDAAFDDAMATTMNFFAASYETVATSMNEFNYQMGQNPELWYEMQELAISKPAEYNRKMGNILYESVRLVNPLAILLRKTTADVVVAGRAIPADSLIIAFPPAVLQDPQLFPNPKEMRTDLSEPQKQAIRLAWGIDAGEDADIDRFCKGYAYAVAAMRTTFDFLLRNFNAPQLDLEYDPIRMTGTQKRPNFSALFTPVAA